MFEMDSVNVSLLLLKHARFARTIMSSGCADRGLSWRMGTEVSFQFVLFLFTRRGEGRQWHSDLFLRVARGPRPVRTAWEPPSISGKRKEEKKLSERFHRELVLVRQKDSE